MAIGGNHAWVGCASLVALMLSWPQGAIARDRLPRCEIPLPETAVTAETLRNQPLTLELVNVPRHVPRGPPVSGLSAFNLRLPAAPTPNAVDWDAIRRIEVLRDPDGCIPRSAIPTANGFGVLYGNDPTGGSINIVSRPFGIRDGRILSGRDWMRDVTAPFSLLCRSDEGAPVNLAPGTRYTYRVPGDDTSLRWALSQSYLRDTDCFGLPDGGYQCSSAAGTDPDGVLGKLNDAQRLGLIQDVELDGCDQFLPESGGTAMGCMTGGKRFPEKAVHYSGWLGGTLSNPYSRMPIDDGWVLLNPVSPGPFFDPGWQQGDELGPRIVRSDADGNYRVPLGGLSGPMEITVAKECAQHTTVAIADGLQPATPTQTASNALPPPASQPRPKPPESTRVCGPDVTEYVIDILDFLYRTWQGWDAPTKERRCAQLVKLGTANEAWDMKPFAPRSFQQFRDFVAPGYCGIPDWPCGGTVEFMGYCIPAQVVNYVQWGAMTHLCDNEGEGMLWHLARDTVSAGWADVLNLVTLNWGQLRNPVEGKDYEGQWAMTRIGSAFSYGRKLGDSRDFNRAVMKRLLDKYVAEAGGTWTQMDGSDCPLTCAQTAGSDQVKQKLDNMEWGFQWGYFDVSGPDAYVDFSFRRK